MRQVEGRKRGKRRSGRHLACQMEGRATRLDVWFLRQDGATESATQALRLDVLFRGRAGARRGVQVSVPRTFVAASQRGW